MSNPLVQMETSKGEIVLELDAEKAPISVANFLDYARAGHYDGTIFHRVIKGFMLQGGGFTPEMSQKPVKAPIKNEATNGLKNKAGTIAMARTSIVDSATSQFFINTVDNKFLDNAGLNPDKFGYAVFGKVIDGMDIVYAIEQAKTGNKGGHAASLDHEPLDDAMEDGAVVVPGLGIGNKVFHRDRCLFTIQFDHDRPFAGFHVDNRVAGHLMTPRWVC
jgi:peptidyl-prolyl cis-trans isomerase B (cyclophilin B)